MPTLLDTFEAAERTKLARQTLAKMRLTGDGPPFRRLGARIVYSESDIVAWIESRPLRRSTSERAGADAGV